jgi:predicted MPP superfamily phosphohydrolase
MVVGGIESPWFEGEPRLREAPDGVFKLLLSHTPDHLAWASKHGVDLMFAGHVHGGQVCLPAFGPLVMPSRHGRSLDRGWFERGKTKLYVSKGLGGTHPLRWNCPPEVMLLTLRTGRKA